MARAAEAKGVAGLVVDGPVRDLEELIEFGGQSMAEAPTRVARKRTARAR